MQAKPHTYSKARAKTNIYTTKQYCLTRQTLVFGTWNNIVWRPKQYCFIRRSPIIGRRNACFTIWIHLFIFIYFQFVCRDTLFQTILLSSIFHLPPSCRYPNRSVGNKSIAFRHKSHPSAFCQSPENVLSAHSPVVGCNEGPSQRLRLTIWQIDIPTVRRPSNHSVFLTETSIYQKRKQRIQHQHTETSAKQQATNTPF